MPSGYKCEPYKIGVPIYGTKLTPIKTVKLPKNRGGNLAHVLMCACGNETVQPISAIRLGRIKSCGCIKQPPWTLKQATDAFFKRIKKKKFGCWEWTGYKNPDGYGYCQFLGKVTGTHRISWMIHRGKIPAGMSVLHHCDNPSCANPDHLWIGTQDDNMKDCSRKGRIVTTDRHGEKCPTSILKNEQVIQIKEMLNRGELHRNIAAMFGVCRQSIGDIKSGKTWSHISPEKKCLQSSGVCG